MGIVATWDDRDQTVILVTVADVWTWADLFHTLEQMATMMNAAARPVDLIADFQRDTLLPPDGFVENAKRFIKAMNQLHQMRTIVLVLGKSSAQDVILSAAETYSPPHCSRRVADSVDEARTLLKKPDA